MSRYDTMGKIKRAVVQIDGVFLLQTISWIEDRKNRSVTTIRLSRSQYTYFFITGLECDIMLMVNTWYIVDFTNLYASCMVQYNNGFKKGASLMMFSKSIAIPLAMLMTIFLAGCSNGNTSSSNVPSTPLSSSEPAQSSSAAETRIPLITPEPSTTSTSLAAATASTDATSISITSDYVLAEKTYSNHTEVSFTDKETIGTIAEYFQNLKESSIEMPSRPEIGSYLFTVSISNDEGTTTYRFSAPQKDGTLYCKDLSTSEWSSMTGWIQVSEAGVYDYIKNLFE